MNSDIDKQLQEEREKLNNLIDEALEKGASIGQYETIQKQGRRVEKLIESRKSE